MDDHLLKASNVSKGLPEVLALDSAPVTVGDVELTNTKKFV